MRGVAKNDIHFTHCWVNEPSKPIVIWQIYLVHQVPLGAVDGQVGLVSMYLSSQIVLHYLEVIVPEQLLKWEGFK